nr:hypothetical protein [uncultured Carboxylicivirga sp.]
MMLDKFITFADSLYPHEIEMLQSVQQFQDEDRQAIFQIMLKRHDNGAHQAFDTSIDKRKYSAMMKWMQGKLEKMDVDVFFDWMLEADRWIHNDTFSREEGKRMMTYLDTMTSTSYYFIRFYELLISYRDYILIRSITVNYDRVKQFLEQHYKAYRYAKKINKRLNNATVDIIEQSKSQSITSIHWESFLIRTSQDKELDGFTRYKAMIRLSYLYYNYKTYNKLKELLDLFKLELQSGLFYSKRILANYYNNVSMMYAKMQQYEKAAEFGRYAIRKENVDYLLYVNNLCSILLRQGKNKEALKLMEGIDKRKKERASRYNYIGFIALYIKTLGENDRFKTAANLAESYLESYQKEIFEHRWHVFFSSYFKVLLKLENFRRIISLERKFKLLEKEKLYLKTGRYSPKIFAYLHLALFSEGKITEPFFRAQLIEVIEDFSKHDFSGKPIQRLLNELSVLFPRLIKEVKKELKVRV